MRRFTMYRRDMTNATHNADQKNAPDDPQFEGVQFSDGTVAVRWMTAKRSTSVWETLDDMLAIHGHPEYGSDLVWHDDFSTGFAGSPLKARQQGFEICERIARGMGAEAIADKIAEVAKEAPGPYRPVKASRGVA